MRTLLTSCLSSFLALTFTMAPQPAQAIGLCEQVGGSSNLLSYSVTRQEVAIAQWYEHCAESDEGGEDRRSLRYVDIRNAKNKLVRRFITDSTKVATFNRYIAKRAPVEPKGKLAAYLKAGGFTKAKPGLKSPGGRCIASLHPLPAKIEAEVGDNGDEEDSYAVRMKVKAGKKTVLWSTLFEAVEDGKGRSWKAHLHFLPGLQMLVVGMAVPSVIYEPGDEGGVDQRVERTDKVRVFAASRHKKLRACFASTPPVKK